MRTADNKDVAPNPVEEIQFMHDLVHEYSKFNVTNQSTAVNQKESTSGDDRDVILLTGATGALGAHLLSILRGWTEDFGTVSEIVCLVTAGDDKTAFELVKESLLQQRKAPLDASDSRIKCYASTLGDLHLCLGEERYRHLADNVTIIIHTGWTEDPTLPLESFVPDHISGLRNLVNLALFSTSRHRPPTFLFCSSTTEVLASHSPSIPETISPDPLESAPSGYARSKWIAEHICSAAHETTRLRNHISIARIGQLSGDEETGVWSSSDACPLLLSTVKVTGCLPDLDEPVAWLPVNVAAEALVQIVFAPVSQGIYPLEQCPVYHVLNPDRSTRWRNLLGWLRELGVQFEVVDPAEWVRRLEVEVLKGHPSRRLVGWWKELYEEKGKSIKRELVFEMEKTKKVAYVLRGVKPVDQQLITRIWRWIDQAL